MHLVSGPSPWKQPLPVYISSPAPQRAHTQALSASIQSSLSCPLPQFIYLHPLFSHLRQVLWAATHTLKHTMTADQYIIHSGVILS